MMPDPDLPLDPDLDDVPPEPAAPTPHRRRHRPGRGRYPDPPSVRPSRRRRNLSLRFSQRKDSTPRGRHPSDRAARRAADEWRAAL